MAKKLLKVSYRKTPSDNWEGVLRDDKGKIVWACGHSHKCRDYNHSRYYSHQGAARYCAENEYRRRQDAEGVTRTAIRITPDGTSHVAPYGDE